MSSDGEAILAAVREVVETSTVLVCPRDVVSPDAIYRGQHPDTGRPLVFVHPSQVDRVTAGLRILHLPHEIEGATDGTA